MTQEILNKIAYYLGGNKVCISKEEITVTNSVKTLNPPNNANYAICSFESSVTSGITARFFEDGSAPTSSSGIFLSHGEKFDISNGENLRKFKIIQAQAGTHKLTVQYYK